MSLRGWTFLFVGLTFALYLAIAWLSRVRDTRGFYVAGRGVPSVANGMATAADWMSAASFISMAGLISFLGFAGGQYLMGWTGGYVLLALLLAPYLRKFGHFTVPDFVGDRYDSTAARLVAVVCAVFVSFTYVAGQMRGVGIVFSRFLEVDINTGVVIGMAIVFIYATLGGMKGITWTQVAQYWVLITAFLIPAIAISIRLTGHPLPQIGMGSTLTGSNEYLLDKLSAINQDLGFAAHTSAFSWSDPEGKAWINPKLLNYFCVTLALMAGTAGLPHVIVRFYTVKSVRAARWSAFWALFFISILYLTAPATAVFARYYMIDSLSGKRGMVQVAEDVETLYERGEHRIVTPEGAFDLVRHPQTGRVYATELPRWFRSWEKTGLIVWLDDGDGRVRYARDATNEIFHTKTLEERSALLLEHQKWLDGADGQDMRSQARSGPDQDIMVLATPEMAELSNWIIALVAAGGLAAALSTASGLLLVISSSVAHDLYARLINPEASEAKRLLVGRTVIGLAVVIAGILGIYPPGFVSEVVAFAFGLAASSFFPAIVLGIFSKRVGTVPAVAGMVAGITFTAVYIVGVRYGGWSHWFLGISPQGIGAAGMLLNFAVTLGLSRVFPPPGKSIQEMIDSVREPEGVGPAVEIEGAVGH